MWFRSFLHSLWVTLYIPRVIVLFIYLRWIIKIILVTFNYTSKTRGQYHFQILADFSFRIGAFSKKSSYFPGFIFINLPWGHFTFEVHCFNVYRLQTNKHTDKQSINFPILFLPEDNSSWLDINREKMWPKLRFMALKYIYICLKREEQKCFEFPVCDRIN